MGSLALTDRDTKIIRTPITRKELTFRLRIIPKTKIQSYQSLRFLIDTAIEPPIKESYLTA